MSEIDWDRIRDVYVFDGCAVIKDEEGNRIRLCYPEINEVYFKGCDVVVVSELHRRLPEITHLSPLKTCRIENSKLTCYCK